MNNVLVAGVNGFVGHHVARELYERGIRVIGISNHASLSSDLEDVVQSYVSCDLTNPVVVSKLDLSNVDAIINLAGFAQISSAGGKSELYNKVNVEVHTTLYEECLKQDVSPRIIAVSSGTVYDSDQPLPINEEGDLATPDKANEYVVSKQMMEKAVELYRQKGLYIIIVRPFNHSGPGQLPGFLIPDLGEQIATAAENIRPLLVGNLKTKRDYTDVRDVARAYVELATCAESRLNHSVYNICSGKSVAGTDILEMLKDAFGASNVQTGIDKSKIRPNDVMDIYGSRERLTQDTGWEPEISVKQMVKDYANWKKSS